MSWLSTLFIVTDQRFIQVTRKGLFSKSIVDMSLKQIQSVNYEVKGLQETLLGYGTILVQTFIGDLIIHDVEKPASIYKKLLVTLRDLGIEPAELVEAESAEAVEGTED